MKLTQSPKNRLFFSSQLGDISVSAFSRWTLESRNSKAPTSSLRNVTKNGTPPVSQVHEFFFKCIVPTWKLAFLCGGHTHTHTQSTHPPWEAPIVPPITTQISHGLFFNAAPNRDRLPPPSSPKRAQGRAALMNPFGVCWCSRSRCLGGRFRYYNRVASTALSSALSSGLFV